MELDSRIKAGKRPLTCLDVEQAREFVGKQCLFSDSYVNYKNIKEYEKFPQYTGVLNIKDKVEHLRSKEDYIFKNGTDGYCYSLVLPLEWIKEATPPEFEPYTLDAWERDFKIGDIVVFCGKENTCKEGNYCKCIYSGYLRTAGNRILVILGAGLFSFDELFKLYEIRRNGYFETFGKKTNEAK